MFHTREHLHRYIGTIYPRHAYLEFGVASGESLAWWAGRELAVGIDGFEGLPEPWAQLPAGHFARVRVSGGGGDMSDEETVAAVRANYEHGRGATFEETEVLFRALDATERERDAARAELALASAVVEAVREYMAARTTWDTAERGEDLEDSFSRKREARTRIRAALAAYDAHTKANP